MALDDQDKTNSPEDLIECKEVVYNESTSSSSPCKESAPCKKSSPCDSKFDDQRTFSEELEQHKNGVKIWAFGYGEEVAKKTEENINAYQKRFLAKHFVFTDKSPDTEKISDDYSFSSVTSSSLGESQPSSSRQYDDQKTPHSEKCVESATCKRTRCSETNDVWTSQRSRDIPLPLFPWANNDEVWQTMVYKEEATSRTRNCRLFENPFSFLPRMRAILVDWIMEVCEVYRLRRVTYYLSVDYIDRFLSINPHVPKNQLQLIGISALFIAAKLEEIYPPKLSEFSYVCDGACTNDDILECEVLLLNTLDWDVNPMTPTGWLNLYMQVYFNNIRKENNDRNAEDEEEKDSNFFYPQYSSFQFVVASHLIDLFSLDPGFLLFNYSIIVAAGMYFLFGRSVALKVSGLIWDDLKDCTEYMAVFYSIVRDTHDPKLQTVIMHEIDERQEATYNALKVWIPQLTTEEHHSLQTHVVDLKYFEKAAILRLQRMGLRVRKTFVAKRKVSDQDPDTDSKDLDDSEEFVEVDPEEVESPIVMFEIEKISLDSEGESDSYSNFKFDSSDEASYFSSKSKYTFDEILIGINDTTTKTLLPRKLGQDLQVLDEKE